MREERAEHSFSSQQPTCQKTVRVEGPETRTRHLRGFSAEKLSLQLPSDALPPVSPPNICSTSKTHPANLAAALEWEGNFYVRAYLATLAQA